MLSNRNCFKLLVKMISASPIARCPSFKFLTMQMARWAPVAAITGAAVAITVAAAAKSLRRPAAKSMFLRRLRRRAVSMAVAMATVMAAAMAAVMVASVMVTAVMVAAVIVAAVMVVGNLWIKSWL